MNQQREQIEHNIASALAMLPGLSTANRSMAGKLVYAAVEPWVTEPRTSIPVAVEKPSAPAQRTPECVETVTAFCQFMLTQIDPEQRPSEYALEQIVNDWMAKPENAADAG